MALSEKMFICAPLDQTFFDKDTGLPLANGTLTFVSAADHSTPKQVYQLTGAFPNYSYISLGTVITLSSIGTIQNSGGDNVALYLYPFQGEPGENDTDIELYFITCRNSGGVQQWTRDAWPNLTTGNDPLESTIPITNQISNSQFSRTLLNKGQAMTISVTTSDTCTIAPDWFLEYSGTGNIIVQQIPITGTAQVVTNPPYALDINVGSGVTNCKLVQRMYNNSGLWTSTSGRPAYISGLMVGQNMAAGTAGATMFFRESSGTNATNPVQILAASFGTGVYSLNSGVSNQVPASTNTIDSDTAYIDIYIAIPSSTHIRLTSIQAIPTADANAGNQSEYDQDSSNREQALMGDYYIPRLEYKPIPSILVGWDFPLNPAQAFPSPASEVPLQNAADYIWDQTIAGRTGASVSFQRNSTTGGLQFVTTDTNNAFYILQYLDGNTAKKIIQQRLSVMINSYKSSAGNAVTMRVFLLRAPNATLFPTSPGTQVVTINPDGTILSKAAGWTEIPRSNLTTATVSSLGILAANTQLASSNYNYGFNGWQITDVGELSDTNKFAIVITWAYQSVSTAITINACGCCYGDIPSLPAPQSRQEVYDDCAYYFENTYQPGVAVGTATTVGQQMFSARTLNTALSSSVLPTSFTVSYIHKRANPNISFYSPSTGTIDKLFVAVNENGTSGGFGDPKDITVSTGWNVYDTSVDRTNYLSIAPAVPIANALTGVLQNYEAIHAFHNVIDARIGYV